MQLRSSWLALFHATLFCCLIGACSDHQSSSSPSGSAPSNSSGAVKTNAASSSGSAAPSEAIKTAAAPDVAATGTAKAGEEAARITHSELPADGSKLYAQQCALCHGVSGDGAGEMKLDPPARSFQSGKFSFGNTPEQLFKTITAGIPGRSPMPAFELVLTETERRAIVEHLKTLMPVEENTSVESTEMIVLGKPVFARGLMHPIADGTPTRPRALMLGRPEGLSFEYRVDDVRLLGVRLGRFAARRDWGGRGGDALEALGRILALMQKGDPDATFRMRGAPVAARFRGTWARGDESLLEIELVADADHRLGRLEEHLEVIALREGTGFERSWRGEAAMVEGLLFDPLGALAERSTWSEHAGWWWQHVSREDGTTLVTAVRAGSRTEADDGRVLFAAAPAVEGTALPMPAWRCVSLVASVWDDTRRGLVAEALGR